MTNDDVFEQKQEDVRKGILDIPTILTKANALLDLITPIVTQLSNGSTGVNVQTTLQLAGGQLTVEINSNIKLINETNIPTQG